MEPLIKTRWEELLSSPSAKHCFEHKGNNILWDPSSGCSADSIGSIIGVKDSSTLQVTRDGSSLANGIFMDKLDGEVGGLAVYCSCWDSLMGIMRTLTAYYLFVSPDFIAQELEESMDHQWK